MSKFKWHLMIIVLLSVTHSSDSFGLAASDFDTNPKDGHISEDEFMRFIASTLVKPIFLYDQDGDLKLSEVELGALQKDIESKKISNALEQFRVEFVIDNEAHLPKGVPILDFAEQFKTADLKKLKELAEKAQEKPEVVAKTKEKKQKKGKLLIRGDYEHLSWTENVKTSQKAKPAFITYARNDAADNEAWGFKGAIIRPTTLGGDEDSDPTLIFVPGIEINQLRNTENEKKDVDSLVFRLGLHSIKDNWVTATSYLGGSLDYATDTDFDDEVLGISSYFHPLFEQKYWSAGSRIGPFMLALDPILRAEYGEVLDAGERDDLIDGETYSRFGLQFDLNFWLYDNERLSGSISYLYLDSFSGSLRDRKYFSSDIKFQLDEAGHYFLQGSYVNGDKSIALEDEESWKIGFGLRF